MAHLTFRDWHDGDDLALLQIWGDPENPQAEQFRQQLKPASETPWSRTLVAEDQGVPVAAGTVYETPLHPERLWAYVEVARDHRRQGVGTELLGRLRVLAAHAPSGVVRLRTRTVPDGAGEAFALARGLARLQRTRLVIVEPGAVPAPRLTPETGPQLEEAATGSVELTWAVSSFYNAVHSWDPADMTLGRAQQLLLGEPSGAAGAVVYRDRPKPDGGTINAFAVSYTASRGEGPADVLIGYDPALPEDQVNVALTGLLGMLVHQYPVQLEVDDAMVPLAAVVRPLVEAATATVAAVIDILGD